jgi:DNA processing protein
MKEMHRITQEEFKGHPLLCRLLTLHTIPKELYILGTLPEVTLDEYGRATPRILTVVGSRKNSTYGRNALTKLISSLKGHDVIILSGLALGIDGLAHQEALKNNLLTLAVPGSGLDRSVLYPRTHHNLAKEILEQGGALISELDPKAQAAPWTFPQRNRIMAALSDALLVIEAEEKSGTLITARQALELGKDIGAVPGEIFSETSAGTNMLIHEGAYPITSEEDLLSLLHLSKKENDKEETEEISYTENEKILIDILREPSDKDTLFAKSNLTFSDFITAFSSLEINACIEETFGEVRRIV